MTLPQKQVGSLGLGGGPIIRNNICAPQCRFSHSHHSSHLFFTNATSTCSNASRRCTFRCVCPHSAGQPVWPRPSYRPNSSIAAIWRSANGVPAKKMLSAYDYDRSTRGWFSSQVSLFHALHAAPGTATFRTRISPRSCRLVPRSTPRIGLFFTPKQLISRTFECLRIFTFASSLTIVDDFVPAPS